MKFLVLFQNDIPSRNFFKYACGIQTYGFGTKIALNKMEIEKNMGTCAKPEVPGH